MHMYLVFTVKIWKRRVELMMRHDGTCVRNYQQRRRRESVQLLLPKQESVSFLFIIFVL